MALCLVFTVAQMTLGLVFTSDFNDNVFDLYRDSNDTGFGLY